MPMSPRNERRRLRGGRSLYRRGSASAGLKGQVSPPAPARGTLTGDRPPYSLPAPSTPLIGREHEATAARQHVLAPHIRLVTFTGPPGIGKTRLALYVAREVLDQFCDGVFFVDLAPIKDPALVVAAIGERLAVKEAGGQALLELIKHEVGDKHLLLLLDNFEQVIAAAPQMSALLAACLHLKIIVTSRAALRLSWEHEFPVPPLEFAHLAPLPALVGLSEYPAVALFLERARAVKPDFTLSADNGPAVAEVCARLEGVPLAIKLAAARSKLLSPQTILDRLRPRLDLLTRGERDVPPRQQTLRSAIAWSYELLEAAERALFERLSVFSGSFSFDAVGTVCTPDLGASLLEGLAALVDQSLLRQEITRDAAPRFRMLEVIREFAAEQLAAHGDAERIGQQHAGFFVALAETAQTKLGTGDQDVWLRRLELEHDNLRAALGWAIDRSETEIALRLASALTRFWLMRGHHTEGRELLERVLAASDGAATLARAKALRAAAHLLWIQGDYGYAAKLSNESLALSRELGDRPGIPFSLHTLGLHAYLMGDHARGEALLEESLRLAKPLGDKWLVSLILTTLGRVASRLGDSMRAEEFLEEGLSLAQASGDKWLASLALASLGMLKCRQGDVEQAAALYGESLSLARALGDRWWIAWGLEGMAEVAQSRGQPERAARLLASARASRDLIHAPPIPPERSDLERVEAAVRRALDEQVFAAAWEAGRARPLEQAIEDALSGATVPGPPATTAGLRATRANAVLTHRQQEVATLIARGHTNREIAAKLVITERTAATHVQHILNRLGFGSRSQIAAWAVERGLHAPSTITE